MPDFNSKFAAIKSKQDSITLSKQEEERAAADAATLEQDNKKNELLAEKEKVEVELAEAQKAAEEAGEAITQADAFIAEQQGKLDPEVQEEIDALKTEARTVIAMVGELRSRLTILVTEIATFEEKTNTSETPQSEISPRVEAPIKSPLPNLRLEYASLIKRIQESEANGDKESLNTQQAERSKLLLSFKKEYGYDESLDAEAKKKCPDGGAETDGTRVVFNNYLGTELPIVSRELALTERGYGQRVTVIDDNSREGISNRSLLVTRQIDFITKIKKANEALKVLPEETKKTLLEETQLDLDGLKEMEFFTSGSGKGEYWGNKNITEAFKPIVGLQPTTLKGELSGEATEKLQNDGMNMNADDLARWGNSHSDTMTNVLFLYKIAKEKGLVE